MDGCQVGELDGGGRNLAHGSVMIRVDIFYANNRPP